MTVANKFSHRSFSRRRRTASNMSSSSFLISFIVLVIRPLNINISNRRRITAVFVLAFLSSIFYNASNSNRLSSWRNITPYTRNKTDAVPLFFDKSIEENYEKKLEHEDDEKYTTIIKGKIIPTGTTAMSHYLNQHPSVIRGKKKWKSTSLT